MGWIYIIIAGIFETGFTTCMRLMENHKNLPFTILFYACIFSSFFFLQQASKTLPLGTAYAVWTGIGACGTAIIGLYFFKEPLTFNRIFFLSLLIISIIGLKFSVGQK
jgi:quaternary ammonium compound-resistance protein SugE